MDLLGQLYSETGSTQMYTCDANTSRQRRPGADLRNKENTEQRQFSVKALHAASNPREPRWQTHGCQISSNSSCRARVHLQLLSYVVLGSSTSNSATAEPFHLSYKPVTPILRGASTSTEVSLAKDHIHLYICLKHSLAKNLSPDSPFSIKPIWPSRTSEVPDLQSQIHTSIWESLSFSHLSSYLGPVHLSAAGFPRNFTICSFLLIISLRELKRRANGEERTGFIEVKCT